MVSVGKTVCMYSDQVVCMFYSLSYCRSLKIFECILNLNVIMYCSSHPASWVVFFLYYSLLSICNIKLEDIHKNVCLAQLTVWASDVCLFLLVCICKIHLLQLPYDIALCIFGNYKACLLFDYFRPFFEQIFNSCTPSFQIRDSSHAL